MPHFLRDHPQRQDARANGDVLGEIRDLLAGLHDKIDHVLSGNQDHDSPDEPQDPVDPPLEVQGRAPEAQLEPPAPDPLFESAKS